MIQTVYKEIKGIKDEEEPSIRVKINLWDLFKVSLCHIILVYFQHDNCILVLTGPRLQMALIPATSFRY